MTFAWIQDGAQSAAFQGTLSDADKSSRVYRVQKYWNATHADYDTAIEAAAAAAHTAGGGMVWFDGDTDAAYDVSGFAITSKDNITFAGNGATLKRRSGLVSPDTTTFGTFTTCSDLKVTGLKWDNNNLERFGGLAFYGCVNTWVWGNRFFDSDLNIAWQSYDHFGIVWLNQEDTSNPGRGLHCWDNVFEDIEGIEFDNSSDVNIHDNTIRRAAGTCAIGSFLLNDATNVLSATVNSKVHHNIVIDPRKRGIMLQHEAAGGNNATVRDLSFNNNTVEHRVAATGTGTTANTSTSITGVTGTFVAGQYIFGTNIPSGAYITAVGTGTLTISAAATGSGLVTLTTTYAGPSALLDITTAAASGTGNSLTLLRIENNDLWVDPNLPSGARTVPHLRVRHVTGNAWTYASIRGNKLAANTTDWAMDIRFVTTGRIEDNEVYGAGPFGILFSNLTGCLVGGNRAQATTDALSFVNSGGSNVLDDNRALGSPTRVWSTSTALVATDTIKSPGGHISVVAAAALPLTLDAGDVVTISGNTNITSIPATGFAGRRITFVFTGTPTLTNGSNLKIGANFVATADDAIELASNGTNWYRAAVGAVN